MPGSVVFTGRGIDPGTGKLRVREDWCALARSKGFSAHPKDKVDRHTTYLVASEDDTVKARKAREHGTQVISYNDFYAMCKGGAAPASFNAAPPPAPIDTSAMEHVEGWGMF